MWRLFLNMEKRKRMISREKATECRDKYYGPRFEAKTLKVQEAKEMVLLQGRELKETG
jgi:hypothetical protein